MNDRDAAALIREETGRTIVDLYTARIAAVRRLRTEALRRIADADGYDADLDAHNRRLMEREIDLERQKREDLRAML